jgi:hypothetical protein
VFSWTRILTVASISAADRNCGSSGRDAEYSV